MQKVIFQIATKSGIANDNIPEYLIENLQLITPKTMRKKIVVCSIELIQNNLKHNPEYTAKLSITENINEYVISIKETINKSKLENLKNKINEINKTEIDQLNQIYNQNLENNQINTGNGLVLCKLKSTKNIYIYYSETSNNLVESRIDITFEKL